MGNKLRVMDSVVSGLEKNITDISKVCYPRCIRTADGAHLIKDRPLLRKLISLGCDHLPWPTQLGILYSDYFVWVLLVTEIVKFIK